MRSLRSRVSKLEAAGVSRPNEDGWFHGKMHVILSADEARAVEVAVMSTLVTAERAEGLTHLVEPLKGVLRQLGWE